MSALLNNRYRILQTLGSGGCGETYLAEDAHMPSKRRCVIKQLKPLTNDPVTYQIIKERFEREAAILERLGKSSDQIPTLYAYFTESNEFYLVQDWIEGKNLIEKVREEGTFGDSQVKSLLVSLLPVLDYIHSQGIIHRDIKPENIMLRMHDGKPVLIDFGAVKEVVSTVVDSNGTPTSSIVIGSPGFMPLEQAAGKPVFASDLYGLGLTAIYLLTGKRPQELTDPLTGGVAWRKHAANVSDGLASTLEKAIQPLARERYETAREMLKALQHDGHADSAPAKRPPPLNVSAAPPSLIPQNQPASPSGRHGGSPLLAYVLVLLFAVLFAGAAVALFYERSKATSTASDTRVPEASPSIPNVMTQSQNANTVRPNAPANKNGDSVAAASPPASGRKEAASPPQLAASPTTRSERQSESPQIGMRIISVRPNSAADEAGLRAGQILLSLDGQPIRVVTDARVIAARNVGRPITAMVLDDGRQAAIQVTPRGGPIGVNLCRLDVCRK